ncbi:Flp pilus assembly protein TadG [Pseudovibrio denitrificans]|uniref:Flp pilus assembly protein TadG n=2 Tax=Pseudovibrio denitrificans TaxID=258256 RepID=A0A1I7AQG8_9HYPH|nr:pilus assembly protein TadG-related protein [Pseudovibrio denitrificans]SFT77093.1 Flp pilus assembly protein TadG [Pseudovibrio denitrificans]
MGYFKQFSDLFKKFNRSEDGVVAVLVAVLMVLMIVFAGMAIDFGMGFNTRRAVNQALDAAVLAVANKLSTTDMSKAEVQAMIEEYFEANIKDSIGEDVEVTKPIVKYEIGGDTISASASAKLSNSFSPMIGLLTGGSSDETSDLAVGSSSTARFPRSNVEVSVIVDVTGSMRSHIGALKRASTSLLNALLPEDTDIAKSRIRVSFIPYSNGVKLDNTLAEKATFDVSYYGCVHERIMNQATTEVPHDFEDDEGNTDYIGSGYSYCPRNAKIVPLTADRTKIESSIRQLSAGGGTAGQIGIAWGWYTISPRWSSFWPTNSKPLSYDTPNIRKYAVFMTDGDFNVHYRDNYNYDRVERAREEKIAEKKRNGTWTEGPNPDGSNKFTRDEHEFFANKIDWRYSSSYGEYGTSSARAKEICKNMKDKNITVYSVHFGSSYAAKRVMESCATSSSTFYKADNESELIQAFEKIANDIKNIYLSQ